MFQETERKQTKQSSLVYKVINIQFFHFLEKEKRSQGTTFPSVKSVPYRIFLCHYLNAMI